MSGWSSRVLSREEGGEAEQGSSVVNVVYLPVTSVHLSTTEANLVYTLDLYETDNVRQNFSMCDCTTRHSQACSRMGPLSHWMSGSKLAITDSRYCS